MDGDAWYASSQLLTDTKGHAYCLVVPAVIERGAFHTAVVLLELS
jgi:hypothetical protein